jgi:CRP-like cAMP-binding protein
MTLAGGSMIEAHLRRVRARHSLNEAEEAVIRACVSDVRTVSARKTIIHAGEVVDHSTILIKGLTCRYKDLNEGQRQITELHVAGDFLDLHGLTLKRLDQNVMALTACRIALVPHRRLVEITEQYPRLTRVYWFSTNLDAAVHREWELSLGRRTAVSRCAHLLCELRFRLEIVGLADTRGYDLPLSQIDLAECLGLTSVHVNRSLRRLREDNIVTFKRGRVEIHDLAALEAVAEFDPAYLYPTALPL